MNLVEFITTQAPYAHWYIFTAIILAGFNLPFSADVLILLSAILAATVVPEHTWLLFFTILIGCYLSAMCAYWFGRILGSKLKQKKWFRKLLNPQRLAKIKRFHEKYGLWTLVIGRFIPFGVRNCIFMSSGMSKLSFRSFILKDAIACTLWCSTAFYLFYTLSQNYEVIWQALKAFNLLIFSAFSVAVISFVWYKSRKKAQVSKLSTN